MSRYCGDHKIDQVLLAAEYWRDQCLLNGKSVFGDENIWTLENIEQLTKYFVNNLDYGEGNFLQKLENQLEPANNSAKQLAAEMMWVLLLCPSNIGPDKKRENVNAILLWAGMSIDQDNQYMSDEVLKGIGSGGTAYNNLRWKELVYLINLVAKLLSLSKTERSSLLSDGNSVAKWCESIDDNERRQFRHMFLYLLFPDEFERIFGTKDRIRIISAFSGQSKQFLRVQKASKLDYMLKVQRDKQAAYHGTDKLDWYLSPLRALWMDTSSADATDGVSIFSTLMRFIEQSNTDDLHTRDYPSSHRDLTLRVSFGTGNQAHVTWMAFLGTGQTPTNGIYPVYLYYKSDHLLVLARGISATNVPKSHWVGDELVSISEYYKENLNKEPIRYGDSYVYEAYDLADELDEDQVNSDLSSLIDEYKELIGQDEINEPLTIPPDDSNETDDAPTYDPQIITFEDAMDGVFMSKDKIEMILSLMKSKKNVVLQGPPGVGKTFIAKKLAYALMGTSDKSRVEMIQFHQTYAYEDFVQGYRPSDAGFELKNGVFHQFCTKAAKDPDQTYVFIIDEINRGNLSKIFGELMMLVEADKRGEKWAMPLTYSKDLAERFYIPENVYIVGLMNTADRSLALVDYALRRRFAFINLAPEFKSERFTRFMTDSGSSESMITKIITRMSALNERIASDAENLGPGFCIGHSFFCASPENDLYDDLWFEQIINYEIAPLLGEYWFDEPNTVDAIVKELLA